MTREDALKIVRENYPHFGTTEPWLDLEKALATLIPELRESEDERIINAIIGILKNSNAIDINVSQEKMIAWLEKQKEPVVDKEGMYYYLGGKFISCGYPAMESISFDFDMSQQEKQKVDLEKFTKKIDAWKARYNNYPDNIIVKGTMAFTARMFYMYPNVAREWYDSLPKVTLD